jgi:nanoRNase/pAp phosphatase (c-di-AMP/oligoRNAs hydrolase)
MAADGGGTKVVVRSIAERNGTIGRIMKALEEREGFLVLGHKNPDEDCIASMVAFSLLVSKLNKQVYMAVCGGVQDQFAYLLNICRYNSIDLIEDCDSVPPRIEAMVALDTPKPEMLAVDGELRRFVEASAALRMEIDHHLGADSSFFGDPGYRLVDAASSASELVGVLALKMEKDAAFMARHDLDEVLSRNLVLSVLTGIIGDSRMGKYLKTRKERWFYELFSSIFDQMLTQKTRKGSSNFTTKEEVFSAIASLSTEEERCFGRMMGRSRKAKRLRFVLLGAAEAAAIRSDFGDETMTNVAKSVADRLAEECGFLGLVAYPDPPEVSDFVQFRLRRSAGYQVFDLREVLSAQGIANGGGHPGAIGFRFPKAEVPDFESFALDLVEKISAMAESTS